MASVIKIYVVGIALCFIQENCLFSQEIPSNDSVKYKVLRKGSVIISEKLVEPVSYYIYVDISNLLREEYKKITKTKWLELLGNEKTDWAANLILYDLYRKDAITFSNNMKKREDWVLSKQKNRDIKYWKSNL
jgi:hypothetical protein